MAKLTWKPCPFCGGTDIRTTRHQGEGRGMHRGEDVYSMCCYQCGAKVPNMYEEHGLKVMNSKWNKRVGDGWLPVEESTIVNPELIKGHKHDA